MSSQPGDGSKLGLKTEVLSREDPDEVLELTMRIGKGAFGEVFKGFFRATRQLVAVKLMEVEDEKGAKKVEDEIRVLQYCDHPHIIKYYGCYYQKDKLWVSAL